MLGYDDEDWVESAKYIKKISKKCYDFYFDKK